MIYFKCKPVIEDGELLGFVYPSSLILSDTACHFFFDPPVNGVEIHALNIQPGDVAEVLAMQHSQCNVVEVDFSEIENDLKECRVYKEINERTVSKIRGRYDINREFSIMKLEKTDPEYLAMIEYINDCRAEGTAEKVSIGLKQA